MSTDDPTSPIPRAPQPPPDPTAPPADDAAHDATAAQGGTHPSGDATYPGSPGSYPGGAAYPGTAGPYAAGPYPGDPYAQPGGHVASPQAPTGAYGQPQPGAYPPPAPDPRFQAPPDPVPLSQAPQAGHGYTAQGLPRTAYGDGYGTYAQPWQGYGPPAPVAPPNTSAIVLTVVSGIAALSSCFLLGVPSGIFGIVALTANATDPARSRVHARRGWWAFGINAVLAVAAFVAFVVIAAAADTSDGYDSPTYSPTYHRTVDVPAPTTAPAPVA